MRRRNSKYIIPNSERKHYHLVVSKETHDVIKYYAEKWRLTITEATQRLLANNIKKILDERRNNN